MPSVERVRQTAILQPRHLDAEARALKIEFEAGVLGVAVVGRLRSATHLASIHGGAVNGAAIFLKSGAAKFPSLAGWRSAASVIGSSVF